MSGAFAPVPQRMISQECRATCTMSTNQALTKMLVQVLLRWEIQRGVSTPFKAVNPEHIQSNLEALDFELPQDDMRALTTIGYSVSALQAPCVLANETHTTSWALCRPLCLSLSCVWVTL